MAVAMISALEDARVERLLARELPGVREWFAQGIALSTQKEDLSFSGLVMRLDRALADPSREDGNFWVQKARTLFEEQAAIDLEDHAAFRKMATVLANDLGQLRVPYRVQHYVVPVSYRDDHGYLWAFPDPPQPPVAISFTSSTPPQTDEDGDAVPPQQAQEAPEIELGRFCYPEWDSRAEIERSDWTTVIEKRPAWRLEAGRQIETLAAERFSMRSTLRFTPGQRDANSKANAFIWTLQSTAWWLDERAGCQTLGCSWAEALRKSPAVCLSCSTSLSPPMTPSTRVVLPCSTSFVAQH